MIGRIPPRNLLLGLLVLAGLSGALAEDSGNRETPGTWLVRIEEGSSAAAIADSLGAEYVGPLAGVDGYHRIRFYQTLTDRQSHAQWKERVARQLESHSGVIAYEEEVWLERFPRAFEPPDALFPDQWHLDNMGQSGGLTSSDVRVRPVWDEGIDGRSVTIAIVDEGIQFRHPDLEANWVIGSGYDYNSLDNDPSPSDSDDRHGTAVAGISLARSNAIGGLGIAYRASLVPLRLIAGPYLSGAEAEALSYRKLDVDIYNNSWGPSDEQGVRYADSSTALKSALSSNVREGRGGLGNIYVWAAGNGGLNGDNSNYDGYNASPYTISVGAVGHDDIKTGYSEPGANLLIVAPSGGRGGGILTTDNTGSSGYDDGDYYENFSGTSAAAPMVSGVVALLLDFRPDLGWRDVQQLLALSAAPVDFADGEWEKNGAGYWVSHNYGFGRVDAAAAIQLARDWPILGEMQIARGDFNPGFGVSIPIPEGQSLNRSISISENLRIQSVRVRVSLDHGDWGDLRMEVTSPDQTRSVLAEPHANANESGQPGTWTYLSTHHLGEFSSGTWTLTIVDEGTGGSGDLLSWTIEAWGTLPADDTNLAPVANDLFLESVEFPLEVNVLEEVMDPDGDPVEIISLQPPRSGELVDLGDGHYRFTMGETRDGTDHFSVLLTDGRGGVARRVVHVLDPRPVGRNDIFPVESGQPAALPVLRNDLDPDNDPLRLVSIGGRYSGSAGILDDNRILYESSPGFTGVERIQYELTDDSDGNSTGWVTVVVQDTLDVALDFDGVDDHVRLENAPSLLTNDRFTAEAWIYPEDWGEYVTGFGRIFDRDTFVFFLNGFDHSFYNDRSLVAYFILDNGRSVAVNTQPDAVELNKWQHVAFSYNSVGPQPVRIYVDGFPVNVEYPLEGGAIPNRPLSDNGNLPLYMGESESGARAFNGRMTEFRIWDRELDPGLIQARHGQRLSGNEPDLRLYLPLDQTLEPLAVSRGELEASAVIHEAQRVPRDPSLLLPPGFSYDQVPDDLSRHYTLISAPDNGWRLESTLGWLYGDLFPWVYLPAFGWLFTGHDVLDSNYLLYSVSEGWGWLTTKPGLYPWIYHNESNSWFWYLEGTHSPAWYYSSSLSEWFSSGSGVPGL